MRVHCGTFTLGSDAEFVGVVLVGRKPTGGGPGTRIFYSSPTIIKLSVSEYVSGSSIICAGSKDPRMSSAKRTGSGGSSSLSSSSSSAAVAVVVNVGDKYNVTWRNGDKVPGDVLEKRPLKQFRAASTQSLTSLDVPADLGAADCEYYIHYPGFDRRLDEWVTIDRIDVYSPVKVEGPEQHDRAATNKRLKRSKSDGDTSLLAGGGSASAAGGDGAKREEKLAMLQALERENEEITKVKNLHKINLGKYDVETWYYSPFPEDYCGSECLYFCEYCLKYMQTKAQLVRHLAHKCLVRSPPGKLIYNEQSVSPAVALFEIDGTEHKTYCQNLCLLSKLFLDHKTLYYDVDPFLFYILCEVDSEGAHIVGYFSKEKQSQENYNLACILTFPSYQRKGYGKLLISISYELTKREGTTGSPEKPLSDLGKISYRSYWAFVILKTLEEATSNITVHDITQQTGIRYEDITSTLHSLNLIKAWKGQHVVSIKPNYIESQRLQQKKIRLCDPACLHWAPPASGGRVAGQKGGGR